MKKLLLGTALAGSVLLAGSSFAETKVNGYLETTIGMTSNKTASVSENADPMSIGHETTIGLSNSVKLKNGLEFSAGFDVENGASTDQYLKLSAGGTTFAVGNDVDGVADNVSQEDFTPHIAQAWHDAGMSAGAIAGVNTAHGSNGLYLIHKGAGFQVASVYSPNLAATNAAGASSNTARGADNTAASGYDIAVSGDFGVPGLKLGYGISNAKNAKDSGSTGDQEGTTYGVQYSMANVTVGYGRTKNQPVNSAIETTISSYGIAYKVSDALSIGLYAADVEVDAVAKDESYKSAQIGYDLGGMGITLGYYQAEDVGGVAGTDNDKFEIRTVSKF